MTEAPRFPSDGDRGAALPGTPDAAALRRLFETLPDGYLRADASGPLTIVSPSAVRMYGYGSAEEMLGLPVSALYAGPRDRQAVLDGLARSAQIADAVLEGRRKDGSGFWLTLTARAVRDEQGNLIATEGFVRDITPRKRAEEALRESEQRFRAVFDEALSGILLGEPGGEIVAANPAACRILGRSEDELRRLGRAAVADPTDPRLPAALEERTRTGHFRGELRFRRPDGSSFPVEISSAVFVAPDGQSRVSTVFQDVTEHHRAREELAASQRRFYELFRHSPDAINVTRLSDGRYIEANPASLAFLGLSRDELIGRTSLELGIWADPAERDRLASLLRRDGEVSSFEARFVAKGGAEKVGHVSATLLALDGEQVLLSITRDATERTRSERALRESEARLADITASMADWVWEVDPQGVYTYSSARGADLLGRPQHEIVGKTPFDFMPPEEAARVRPVFEALSARRAPIEDLENWALSGSGERVCLLTNGVPVHDETGRFMGYRGVDKDITERKRAEAALARSHDLLLNLARLVPGVIYQYRLQPDGSSSFPYSSPGMNLIYEVTPEEVREDATPVFGRLHPDDAEQVSQAIFASARDLTPFHAEFRVVLPVQGLRWRWSEAHPERLPDGGTLWHGIILDVTDRKLAELESARLEAQLHQAQKMESVGRLAGGIAHDFNNLLTVINGNASLALEDLPETHPVHADLFEIQRAGLRAAGLTRQLLAFSRKQILEPQVLDLDAVVTGLAPMLRRMLGEEIVLTVRISERLGRVRADLGQVEQVVMNLAVNARDAMPRGGSIVVATANVEVGERDANPAEGVAPGRYVMVSVSDTGCGMSPEVLAHLFEPFFTTKEKDRGTGLGLSTVYGIVKQSGGHLAVLSEPGRGSSFKVFLPRVEAAGEESRPRGATTPGTGSETVLVVEDEDAVRHLTERILRRAGYQVLGVARAQEALDLLGPGGPAIDLLLTDVVMPQMRGPELAERLAGLRPGARVLFMSGYTDDAFADHVRPVLGALIGKPFTAAELTSKVREVLDAG